MVREKRSKFIAAKVNINQNIFSSDKEKLITLIPEAINKRAKLEKHSWTWQFTDIEFLNLDNKEYIFGNLGKSRFESVDVVDGDKTKAYQIPNPVATSASFFYDIVDEVLIFEEGPINKNEYMKSFEELVYASNIEIGEIKINLIPIKDQIYKEIQSIEVLTKIEFDIIPPNMIEKDTYKSLNQIVNDENAVRMKMVFENQDGLNKEGDYITEGIEMTSNAYAETKAYGYNTVPKAKGKGRKKQRTRFFSNDSVHQRKLNVNDKPQLLQKLKKFALEIVNILN